MIGINCYKREPQNKKEPVGGEGNECDAEIERELFHDVVEVALRRLNACGLAVCI